MQCECHWYGIADAGKAGKVAQFINAIGEAVVGCIDNDGLGTGNH